MPVTFPEARRFTISDNDFICAWVEHVSRYWPEETNPYTLCLPRLNIHNGIAYFYHPHDRQFCLDFLCRMLVPDGYRNRMQATPAFMQANSHLLAACRAVNPITGIMVNGAKLANVARCPSITNEIEAIFEADIGELDPGLTPVAISAFPVSGGSVLPASAERHALIQKFVRAIHADPFTPTYRRKSIGRAVTGWPDRLREYFWPSPRVGLKATHSALKPILHRATALAGIASWTPAEDANAVSLANDIFKWGGVPQPAATVTPANIRAVVDAANGAHVAAPFPPMNSGWTKVAAFFSEHLEIHANLNPQVIWDSRVATSITSRIDGLLVAGGATTVPDYLAGVGAVEAGRGGTRPRPLTLKWPNGYGSWVAQLAGSQLVAEIRDELNADLATYGRMPAFDAAGNPTTSKWTVRGVEMVLFMDGY